MERFVVQVVGIDGRTARDVSIAENADEFVKKVCAHYRLTIVEGDWRRVVGEWRLVVDVAHRRGAVPQRQPTPKSSAQ